MGGEVNLDLGFGIRDLEFGSWNLIFNSVVLPAGGNGDRR